jgi:hypothetical protein
MSSRFPLHGFHVPRYSYSRQKSYSHARHMTDIIVNAESVRVSVYVPGDYYY